jgi:peptidoglycan/LPS O-acetylase OafA/YrhL
MKKYEFIDAGRGFAIVGVVLVHSCQRIQGLPIPVKTVAGIGQMGVQLFFVLSALTLCLSWSRKGGGLRKFFFRRFFRIAPLYYCGIVIYASLSFIFDKGADNYSFSNVVCNLGFVHGFVPAANNNVVPGGWSIGTEMAFYALFPFLFSWINSCSSLVVRKCALLSVGSLLMTILLTDLLAWPSGFTYFNIGSQLPVFLVGFLFWRWKFEEKQMMNWKTYRLLLGFLLVFLLSSCSFVYVRSLPYQVFFSMAFVLFIELIDRINFLKNRWICELGRRSYSIYLFHFLFAHWLAGALDSNWQEYVHPVGRFFVVFGVSLFASSFLASITSQVIEERGQRFGVALEEKFYWRTR